jgi:hypothetical protein
MISPENYPYQIKWVDKHQRADLPEEVRVLFFFTIKEHPVSVALIEKTRQKYPEYFERTDKQNIFMT